MAAHVSDPIKGLLVIVALLVIFWVLGTVQDHHRRNQRRKSARSWRGQFPANVTSDDVREAYSATRRPIRLRRRSHDS